MQTATATSESDAPTEAFHGFYREHYGFVWQVVGRFGVAPDERSDAVQDTFVTAFRRRSGMRGAPRSWLYGIARRVASNYRRGAGRAARKHSALASVGMPGVTPAVADALVVLDRFLEGLGDTDRELFVLSEVLGWSGQEIAETTGIEARIVYARLRLSRLRLVDAAPDGMLDALSTARTQTPRASDRGWVALAPLLGEAGKVAAMPLLVAKIASAVAVVGLAIGAVATFPTAEPPRDVVATVDPQPQVPAREPAIAPAPPAPTPRVDLPPVDTTPRRAIAAPKPTATPTSDTTLARDNAMLADMLDALATDPARALELSSTHAREFPTSPQADVRAALRIDALCKLGRIDEGRREADAFLAAHPGSPARRRVQRACEAP